MQLTVQSRLYLSWFVLAAITLLAWWIGGQHGEVTLQANAAVGLSAIAITLIKVRVIIREFMEVRHAPLKLKLITDLWLLVFILAMAVAYFAAG